MAVINADGCPIHVEVEGQAAQASRRTLQHARATGIETIINGVTGSQEEYGRRIRRADD
jgi:hypothetical protein